MTKQALITQDAIITEILPDAKSFVKLESSEQVILAYASGNMRKRHIKMYVGDRVKLEMSPYDAHRARIVYRYRKGK